jgi:hypothetical protein
MSGPTESAAVKQGRGKWSKSGVPHKGWSCIQDADLGAGTTQTCEMCESTQIRYTHTMNHPDYKGPLVVGVVCAGHMQQDLEGARARERRLKNRVARRERWPHTKWKVSRNGNEYRNHAGYSCLVKHWPQGWQLMIRPLPEGEWISGRRRFATAEEAKLAAFDYIVKHPRSTDDDY